MDYSLENSRTAKWTRSVQASNQVSVTFHDVAVYFSEEEWGHLEEWQKELYRNVVEEIHTALLSLGYTIANPDVLVHLKKEEEQHVRACRGTQGEESMKETSTASLPIITPDILLRIKPKEEPVSKNNRSSVGGKRSLVPASLPISTPELFFRIKQKEELMHKSNRCSLGKEKNLAADHQPMTPSISIKVEDDEVRPHGGDLSDSPDDPVVSSVVSLGFKKEETPYDANHQDDVEDESCMVTPAEAYSWAQPEGAPYPNYLWQSAGTGRKDKFPIRIEALMRHVEERSPRRSIERGNVLAPFPGKFRADPVQYAANGSEGVVRNWAERYPGRSRQRMETAALIQRHFTKIAIPIVQQRGNTSPMPTGCHETDGRFRIPNVTGLYDCPQCDKSFEQPSELRIHQRVHRVQVYKCTECGKLFKQVSSLKAHHRIHTGERPYKCTLCEKSFNHASSFTIHQRTHTGNRPYQCSECEKRFSNKSNLLKHERIHSRVRPYQCMDCAQTFTYKSHLLIHQLSHSGERPQ